MLTASRSGDDRQANAGGLGRYINVEGHCDRKIHMATDALTSLEISLHAFYVPFLTMTLVVAGVSRHVRHATDTPSGRQNIMP